MNRSFKLLALCLLIYILSIFTYSAYAISPADISMTLAPTNPSAGESTTITLSTYVGNLDAVSISWFVNGRKISSGVGMKSFSTTAPANGAQSTVRALISFPDGEVEKSAVIKPTVMTLLWQAVDSYVPPFYRGKAMPTAESTIKVVAMPEIKSGTNIVNPKNLLYYWKKNYSNDAQNSGYGKNSITYINDYLENLENIGVTVSTTNGTSSSEANINISVSSPQTSFYRNDTLLGTIWEQALKDGHRVVGSETIVAEPYFISPKELWSRNLVWNWYLNGDLTNNVYEYRKNWLPISVEGGVSGTATVGLTVENSRQLLGGVQRTLNVEF